VDGQAPRWRRRIDRFRQRGESDLALRKLIDDVEQVAEIPSKAIETEDADRIARSRELHKLGQLGAIRLRTAFSLHENSVAAGTLQSVHLGGVVL
jgi:hypothetical protein